MNGNDDVVSLDDYFPLGAPMNERSFNTANPSNSVRYTSHQLDEDFDLDLTYAGARYLDTEIGVWISMDPLRGKFPRWSPYNYTYNNPLRFVDPDGKAADDPFGMLRFAFSQDGTWFGDLFRADQAGDGQLEKKIQNDVKDAAETSVKVVSETADNVSDASTVAAIGGIVAAPFTGFASLTLTGYALAVGTGSDVVSTAAKYTDAFAFDGSFNTANVKALSTGINVLSGRIFGRIAKSFAKLNSAGRFFNPDNGRFVTNKFGFGVTAVRDATSVTTSVIINNQLEE